MFCRLSSRFVAVLMMGAAGLLVSGRGLCQVTVNPGGGAFGNNILLTPGQVSPPDTIEGTLNGGNPLFSVIISSPTDTLMTQASGQAKVDAQDGAINSVWITASNTDSFEQLIANAFQGNGTLDVEVTLQGGGVQTFTDVFGGSLGNGQNFFTVNGNGALITQVCLTATGGFTSLRQIRVAGGTTQFPPAEVPEPGAIGMLLGSAVAGGLLWRKRRRI
jgi:hypothetical protein